MKKHFSAVKIVFVSAVGSLMLLLGLLAFPGAASAYSGNLNAAKVAQHSQLSAYVIGHAGLSSVEVRVSGSGFRSNSNVSLSATENGRSISVQPTIIRTNRNGSFSNIVRIQTPYNLSLQRTFGQFYRDHQTQIVLHASGWFGQSATQVLQVNQYGLIR